MVTLDLYHLPDDVLFLSNNGFHNFVLQVCGEVEADILQAQGIRNVRSLLRSTNLLAILELDCEEINVLKPNACFKCKSGHYVVKQGVKLNLDNLYDALKEKNDKFKKKKQRQQELTSSVSFAQSTATNTDGNSGSPAQNSTSTMTTANSLNILLSNTNENNPSFPKCLSINDHVIFVKDLIEKFSRKTFVLTILKNNEHYQLSVTQQEQTFKAIIKCQCGTKILLPSRPDTGTFVLSNFYSHLTTSKCPIVKGIVEEEKKANDEQLTTQPSSTSIVQTVLTDSNSDSSTPANRSKRRHNQDYSSGTNSSSTNKRKR